MRQTFLAFLAGAILAFGAMLPAAASPTAAEPSGQVLVLLRLPPPHLRPGSDYGGAYGDVASRAARYRIAATLARRNGLTLVDDWPMPLLGVDCFVMTVPVGRSSTAVAATLSDSPGVAWSQPVNAFHGQAGAVVRPDPLFQAQPAATNWHLADLHRIADGRGVKVAVIDSSVEREHPDLVGQVPISANFVAGQRDSPEQHGTAVAGIIGAIADNGIGIAGIAPRARLMALRACWQPSVGSTVCDSFSLAKALYFALERGAGVINLSLGGPQDPLLARLLDIALARGIVVVAAFDRQRADGGFPASHQGVVAVADDGPGPLRSSIFTAPGTGVPTTRAGGTWQIVDGSSYAAAHVSGLFALMRGRRGAGEPAASLVSARPGGGAIDSCASVLRPLNECKCGCPPRNAAVPRN